MTIILEGKNARFRRNLRFTVIYNVVYQRALVICFEVCPLYDCKWCRYLIYRHPECCNVAYKVKQWELSPNTWNENVFPRIAAGNPGENVCKICNMCQNTPHSLTGTRDWKWLREGGTTWKPSRGYYTLPSMEITTTTTSTRTFRLYPKQYRCVMSTTE